MRLKTLLLITAVFFVANAVVALLVPSVQLSPYGLTTGAAERYMAQWAGLGSLVVGLLAFSARNVAGSEARRVVLLTLLGYFIVATALSLAGILLGVMNGLGWVLVVMSMLFGASYGFLLVRQGG
jgi:hypothetical protein